MQDMKFISWKDIKITEGFWQQWQDTVSKNTSHAIYDRFKETGRIDAMQLNWKEGMPDKPHQFWDSDIAKWMEGTAYILYFTKDTELEKKLDEIISYIEAGQNSDGYFNSAFLTLYPERIFTDRTAHELYTAGHLIEAAVAHYYSTGSNRFINMMCRFADYIERVFVIENSAPYKTPGHQELELALVRLWEATDEKRYLELSKYFVNNRGAHPEDRIFSVPNGTYPASPPIDNQMLYDDTYAQDDALAKDLPGAAGHAVRAMYFYTSMADIAREYNDAYLFKACKYLWNDSVNKKMYITGGVSAERFGEAIGTDYVLPNDHSYAETCASVAMSNFSLRMFQLEQDSKYSDMIERQMYNGALVGLSIPGDSFYYDNAMRSRPKMNEFFEGIHATPLLPANERIKVFDCSCCPPNVYRYIAALGQYFYSIQNDTVYIHQYASSTATVTVNNNTVNLTQKTEYPWKEDINISLTVANPIEMTIALRVPGWCTNATVKHNNIELDISARNGYLNISSLWKDGDTLSLHFPMPVVEMESHPNVVNTIGRVALMRGPIIYCLEEIDNTINIFNIVLPKSNNSFAINQLDIAGFSIIAVQGNALTYNLAQWENQLYKPYNAEYESSTFTAIPYFAWANRGKNDMTVWINKQL